MRMTTFLAAALACAALAGCDQTPQAAAPMPPPAASVLPTPPPLAPAPVVEAAATHHHRHHHAWHTDTSSDYAQSDDDSYGYISDSTASGDESDTSAASTQTDQWTDGYGRPHPIGNHQRVAGTMDGKRLDAWHGYDVNCPEQ